MRNMSATTTKRRSALSLIIGAAALAIGAIVLVAPTRDAVACSPVMPKWDYGHTIGELKRSDAVFVAVAVSAKDVRSPRSTRGRMKGTSTAVMTVEKIWKGKPGRRVTVFSNYDWCRGYRFSAGKRYLVFVRKDGRAYRLAWPWAFRDGKAPAAIMKALAAHKDGKVRKANAWYPAGAPAHKGLTVARFRMLAASRRPEDRAMLRRYMTEIVNWAVARNREAIRSKSRRASCLLRNPHRSDADIDRFIAVLKAVTDKFGEYYYGVGLRYSPVAKYATLKLSRSSGWSCPEVKTLTGD